jgi:hypothetical protein
MAAVLMMPNLAKMLAEFSALHWLAFASHPAWPFDLVIFNCSWVFGQVAVAFQ